MTTGREKSDGSIVPKSRRKSASTASSRGGKGTTVSQRAEQLELFFETADSPKGDVAEAEVDGSTPATSAVPKSKTTTGSALPAMTMSEVASQFNLLAAFEQVAANRGAPGPDRQTISDVRKHLNLILPTLQAELLSGQYRPGLIRRVWIPKPGGGQRGLGIADVVDRTVGQAVYRVLGPHFDPTFHPSSHGFRPGRSCHTAITEAKRYLEEGYEWVVDLDLEKFFDRVNHERLIARLEQRVKDRDLIQLIRRMLKAKVVLPDGVVLDVDEGTPQGSPLSPLMSNIVLDELDQELARRDHRFVRYADDVNVYVRSERAGHRVMASITRFIESRLRLRVNTAKSAVARPGERHFVGFQVGRAPLHGTVYVQLSIRTRHQFYQRIRELTPRTAGRSLRFCIERLNLYLRGWLNFFWICSRAESHVFKALDGHVRRRLRALVLRHWKRKRTILRRLRQLGASKRASGLIYRGRFRWWAMSNLPVVSQNLSVAFFASLGLFSLGEAWDRKHAQASLPP